MLVGWRSARLPGRVAVRIIAFMDATAARGGELLERSEELEALDDLVRSVVATHSGRLVFVRGEAGVGKTALVRRFCDSQDQGRLLWGACDPLFTPRPLGPFLDVARMAGGELEQIAAASPRPFELAAALMQELEGDVSVVVLEDVHWADEATLDVLRIVARRIDALPALLIATYRGDEVDRHHPLRVLLGELGPSDRTTRIGVDPFSPEAVEALAVDHGVDPGDLYRKTGGNAFFVTEALASGGAELPETVRDAVLARAARLGSPARRLLETIAVAPTDMELWLLETLAPGSADSLEECLASGMLRLDADRVCFRHELARLAVEASLPSNVLRALNAEILAALIEPRDGEPDLARLAHHAEAASDADAVLRFAPAAAERATSVGAHREAANQYARALRFGDRLPATDRARLIEARAFECYITDENPLAVEAAQEAVALRRDLGDVHAESAALLRLSEYLWCPGRITESWDAARESVALLERLEPCLELGRAYGQLAFLARAAANGEAAARWAELALDWAERSNDLPMLVGVLAALGEAETLQGAQWSENFDRAGKLAEEHGLIEAQGWMPHLIARVLISNRAYPEASRALRRAVEFAGEHGLELYRHYDLAYLARAELDQGNWATAADAAEQVLRSRRASTTPTILALSVIGLLRARHGDPDPWSPLDEAQKLAALSGELPRLAPVAAARAEAAWLEGRHDSVPSFTEDVYRLARELRATSVLGELAVWRRRAGVLEGQPHGIPEPYALSLAGETEPAAAWWAAHSCPYDAALALSDSDVDSSLHEALSGLQELDSRAAAAIVARRLRDRGARGLPRGPRAATRNNPAGLTPREADVLALLEQGLTNPEIAGRLYLSVKTIDHHVAAILRKLDVRSRGEAAAVSVRRGLVSGNMGNGPAQAG